MKITFLLLFLSAVVGHTAFAGSAAIMPDGKHLVRTGEKTLNLYSIIDKSEAELEWPAESKFEYPMIATAKGVLLVAGGKELLSYDPVAAKWTRLWITPDGWVVDDIAYDSKNDRKVIVASNEEGIVAWWIFPGNAEAPSKLFNRRASGASDPVFDSNGGLYFTVAGDLWKGSLEAGDSHEVPFTLVGNRIWPLAIRETGNGNSSGSSAKEIVPLEKWIVLELSRYGGSGWGHVIRVPNADAYENHLPLQWEELEGCGTGSNAAVSADGKSAFTYINDAGRWFEINCDTGALSPLPND